MKERTIQLANEQTVALGNAIAKACHQGTIIHLYGDLGAGKPPLAEVSYKRWAIKVT